jgi:hypothetical protein
MIHNFAAASRCVGSRTYLQRMLHDLLLRHTNKQRMRNVPQCCIHRCLVLHCCNACGVSQGS